MTTPREDAIAARLDAISARANLGLGEGLLAATRWRDALIDVGTMLDDLINDDPALAAAPETDRRVTK